MLDDDIALIGVSFATDSNRKRKRSVWCKDWLRKRELFSHVNLLNELRTSPKDWHNYKLIIETEQSTSTKRGIWSIYRGQLTGRPTNSYTPTSRRVGCGRCTCNLSFFTAGPRSLGRYEN
ncbi:hypothetical protein WA026_022606 [Henosepilachna vigintioctopunctata]|uniref:Uncharacterized protein n=1 Tax=Henosepilachna vigintioctopunctata TaxID=420089 RepID=A0AAW1V6E2_9CUCU